MTTRVPDAIRLKYGRGVVLEPFLNRVYGARGVSQVVLVSPFLSHVEFLTGNSRRLMQRLGAGRSRLTLITREPADDQPEHHEFVSDVAKLPLSEIIYVAGLHAKYYVCETVERSFAVIGSSNLYRWTQNSFEIGVAIESRGMAESLIADLEMVTLELKRATDKQLFKRMGA